MPVMAIYEFDNVTADEYAEFRRKLPLTAAPRGALVHAFGGDDDGFVTIELWENRRALESFVDDILEPLVTRMGLPLTRPRIIDVEDFVMTDDLPRQARKIPIGDMLADAL
ncbi:hypothetical protein [Phenylobacterium sp.]|jgi:hypothetical protein|uniref:hypothetical protein n=1 Tax=Phenylobacterium sp. TaxID=1871053 RepID=UPI002ED7C41B